jgi:hypothetical protein
MVLDQVMTVELPELEAAILAGDYDLACARAAILRDVRNRVRALLGGAEGAGLLRADWARAEPRIDAALIAAPRPNVDPEAGRQTWQARRTAQGTGSHGRRPRLATQGGRRRSSTTAKLPMRAVDGALEGEVYHPADRDTDDTDDTHATHQRKRR